MTKNLEQAISDRKRVLGNPYAFLAEKEELAALRASRRVAENPYSGVDELERFSRPIRRFDGIPVESRGTPSAPSRSSVRTEEDVQRAVRAIHERIWENRADLFPGEHRDPIDMLDPRIALNLMGYSVEEGGALGQIAGTAGQVANVAGLIDKKSRQVLVATGLPPAIRNFTIAHELAHAAMHEFSGMHRDKPMDGSSTNRDRIEWEADKFAVHFLMPERLLRRTFESIFGAAPFVLDESTSFALAGSVSHAGWRPKNVRELSRALASAERFNGASFTSLMNRFRVSRETMAIRLEELGLVSFPRDGR